MIVYISIGNSDDKLSQARWSQYVLEVAMILGGPETYHDPAVAETHGVWYSLPDSAYQNACWCVDVKPEAAADLKDGLRDLAAEYGQESIAWAEAPVTEFLGAEPTPPLPADGTTPPA